MPILSNFPSGVPSSITTELANKVDKVDGKSLSTNDYTTDEKDKLGSIEAGAQKNTVTSVNGKTGAVSLSASDVNAVPITRKVNGKALSADVTLGKSDVGLGNVDNTSDTDKPISAATQTALDTKQPAITVKGILEGDGVGNIIAANETNVELVSLPHICNPNLLDNWYFGNPVNQRGQTVYSGEGYGIDRWKVENSTTIKLTNNGLVITTTNDNGITQNSEQLQYLLGKIVTFSMLTASGLFVLTFDAGGISGGLSLSQFEIYSTSSWLLYIRHVGGGDSEDILAVKLELGSEQTLAHQDANGNWVLNEIPDYEEQLYRCITSTADTSDTYANRAFVGVADGPGAHNAVYRGQNLGSAVTDAQWAAIANGTFKDMYIGDYWVIGGVNWRIAAFDYYMTTGWEAAVTEHHVTIVPDSALYSHVMNDTDVTTGAYVGSKMYTEGLTQAKATINNAFGSAHILNHRQWLTNATANGYATGGSWYDSTVELMTEQNVYGGKIFANCQQGTGWAAQYTIDKSQYPLFAHNPYLISNRTWYWLRDVASAALFCLVNGAGNAGHTYASDVYGVRPAFSIKSYFCAPCGRRINK